MTKIEWVIVSVIGCFVIALVWQMYQKNKQPTFALYKSEWICTVNHEERRTRMIMVGKISVPQIDYVTICDRWDRK